MRMCLALVLTLTYGCALAGLLPQKERETLVAAVLKNFWGKAKLSNGQYAEPSSEEERGAVPVSTAVANRAMDAGEVSGLGEWCRLDWQSHYLSLTKAARAKGLNDKQVAFVSVLHGATQGRIASAMSKRGACNDTDRTKIEQYLKQSKERGLEGT